MEDFFFIGEVSKIFNIKIETLRYYDRIGLLTPSSSTNKGYRIYLVEDLLKLKFILSAKRLGIKLNDIKDIAKSSDSNSYIELIERQEHLIDQKIAELTQMKNYISNNHNNFNEMILFQNTENFSEIKFKERLLDFYTLDLTHTRKSNLFELLKFVSSKNFNNKYYNSFYIENTNFKKLGPIFILKDMVSKNILEGLENLSQSPLSNFTKSMKIARFNFKGTIKNSEKYILDFLNFNTLDSSKVSILIRRIGFILQNDEQIFYLDIIIIDKSLTL